jgi:putative ABC transport system substrate-binding protein
VRQSGIEVRGLGIGTTAIFFVTIAVGLFLPFSAAAAQSPQVPRVGVLSNFAVPDPQVEALKQGLRDLGWVEGQNVGLEYRYSNGQLDQDASLVAELVRLKVDVIVTGGEQGVRAARDATRTIPIVMANSGDPVGTGLVASLARPGGNLTGLSLLLPELGGKRLALLREAVPKVSHVAVLWNPTNAAKPLEWQSTQDAAGALGVRVSSFEVREPTDFAPAFAAIAKARPNALMPLAEPLTRTHRRQISAFAVKNRLPVVAESREFAEAGGFMTYGPSLLDLWQRAASYVDKILKGAKPADLPVEQPTKFELVINLKTAKALGLMIPQSVLIRADEVIQ